LWEQFEMSYTEGRVCEHPALAMILASIGRRQAPPTHLNECDTMSDKYETIIGTSSRNRATAAATLVMRQSIAIAYPLINH
jgi:hypothetical protein